MRGHWRAVGTYHISRGDGCAGLGALVGGALRQQLVCLRHLQAGAAHEALGRLVVHLQPTTALPRSAFFQKCAPHCVRHESFESNMELVNFNKMHLTRI